MTMTTSTSGESITGSFELDRTKAWTTLRDRVLTLSTAALSLSILASAVGNPPIEGRLLIVFAWIGFSISILTALIAASYDYELLRRLPNRVKAVTEGRTTVKQARRCYARHALIIDVLIYSSLILFVAGMVLLGVFAYCNLD